MVFIMMPPLGLFAVPGSYAMLSSYLIMKVFKRYRPEMDKDPLLEIQEIEAKKEEERRRQRFNSMTAEKNDNPDIIEGEAVTESDAFWAIQKEDEEIITDENIFDDENDGKSKGDIVERNRAKEPPALRS